MEELLYPAMEDFSIHFVMDKGLNARTMRIPLRPFTLVGATTRPGMLTSPLRERFGIFHHLDFYSVVDLCSIILRSASILGAAVEPAGAEAIARRSRGTPRIANRLLRRVRDYCQVKGNGVVTAAGGRRRARPRGRRRRRSRSPRSPLSGRHHRAVPGRAGRPRGHRRDHQ